MYPLFTEDYLVILVQLVLTKVDGLSFRLIPEASEVKNAIKVRL